MSTIHQVATVTSKGQITLPKAIRQALGIAAGSKVAFNLHESGEVTVNRVNGDHEDPAITAFLTLLEQDIQAGRHVRGLPDELLQALVQHGDRYAPEDEEIDGEVAL